MRQIAEAASMSLGAAYHYFPSKEALVHEYYRWMHHEHERRLEERVEYPSTVQERFSVVLSVKLEMLEHDRKILVALLSSLADPSHSLSLFSRETATLRRQSLELFERIFEDPVRAGELRNLLGCAAWLAHLGILLFFVHDESQEQRRTRVLVDAIAELFGAAVPLACSPLGVPMVRRATALLHELGLQQR